MDIWDRGNKEKETNHNPLLTIENKGLMEVGGGWASWGMGIKEGTEQKA